MVVYSQPKQLRFLRVEFFRTDDTCIHQFFILLMYYTSNWSWGEISFIDVFRFESEVLKAFCFDKLWAPSHRTSNEPMQLQQ